MEHGLRCAVGEMRRGQLMNGPCARLGDSGPYAENRGKPMKATIRSQRVKSLGCFFF